KQMQMQMEMQHQKNLTIKVNENPDAPVVLGRPSYSYPGYYYDYQNDVEADAGKCILPRADNSCIRQKLYETDGDMDASVALCSKSMPMEGKLKYQTMPKQSIQNMGINEEGFNINTGIEVSGI